MWASEAEEEEPENDQSYRDVEPIALFGKRPNRECDAGNRRGDQEQQAQLDNSRGVQRDAFSNNSGNMPQIAGFAAKRSIVYCRGPRLREVKNAAEEHDEGGNGDAGAQENPDCIFRAPVQCFAIL